MSVLHLASLSWDPDPVFIRLPIGGLPLVWYGVLFALGFFFAFLIGKRLVCSRFMEKKINDPKKAASLYLDRLLWAAVIGTVIGARVGHILFYDLSYYLSNPAEMLKIWHGGLASHGGGVGILLALLFFHWKTGRHYPIRFFRLLDIFVIPTPLVCAFIRLGNFINQEILGTPSSLPWAVTFGHPADGSRPLPRHPVQLYEAFTYLVLFGFVVALYRKPAMRNREGLISGLFLTALFTARFFLEMVKEPYTFGSLNTGQWLGIPFIVGGVALTLFTMTKKATSPAQ